MKNLQADCFGGTTFHADNGIEAKIRDEIVLIHGKFKVRQHNPFIQMPLYPPPSEKTPSGPYWDLPGHCGSSRLYGRWATPHSVDDQKLQTNLYTISLPSSQVVFPSEFLSIPLSKTNPVASHISITPSFPNAYELSSWNPQVCEVINGNALYQNTSDTSLVVPKYAHFKPHTVLIMNLTDVVPEYNETYKQAVAELGQAQPQLG